MIVDICIILFIILGGFIGYKHGFIRSLVDLIGYILVIILAFILKNPISEFMLLHFPFFDFYGIIKGISVLNIAIYEIIAFGLVFSLLTILLKIIMMVTSIFEKLLSMTILLGLPSKILGTIIGIIKNYIIVFAILFILSLPNFSNIIKDSKLQKPILENTPVLSNFTRDSLKVFNEFALLKEKYINTSSSDKFNYDTLELFLKYHIVKPEVVKKLVDSNKLHIKNVSILIEKYE